MVDAVLERIVKAGISHPTPGADLFGDLDPDPIAWEEDPR